MRRGVHEPPGNPLKQPITIAVAAACIACAATAALAGDVTGGAQPTFRYFTLEDTGSPNGPVVKLPEFVNCAPTVAIIEPASAAAFPVGTPIAFTGAFLDDDGDLHTAEWCFDTTMASGQVSEAARSVSGSWTFDAPGVYRVRLLVRDHRGLSASASTVEGLEARVVIFDPGTGGSRAGRSPSAGQKPPRVRGKTDVRIDGSCVMRVDPAGQELAGRDPEAETVLRD